MATSAFREALLSDNENVRKCDLSQAFLRMKPEMVADVKAAMAAPEITAAAISRTLHRFDFPVTEGSVRRCRRICQCWKTDV